MDNYVVQGQTGKISETILCAKNNTCKSVKAASIVKINHIGTFGNFKGIFQRCAKKEK